MMGMEALFMDRTLQRAFCDACWDGNTDMVRQLLAHPELAPDADHSAGLLHAAHRGHWRIAEMLMPVSNALERNSEALWRAAKHRHGRVVRLLAPVSDTSGWEPWQWDEIPASMHLACLPANPLGDL
jgi:hypothetical protein